MQKAQERHQRIVKFPNDLDRQLRRLARLRSLDEDRDVSVHELIVEFVASGIRRAIDEPKS